MARKRPNATKDRGGKPGRVSAPVKAAYIGGFFLLAAAVIGAIATISANLDKIVPPTHKEPLSLNVTLTTPSPNSDANQIPANTPTLTTNSQPSSPSNRPGSLTKNLPTTEEKIKPESREIKKASGGTVPQDLTKAEQFAEKGEYKAAIVECDRILAKNRNHARARKLKDWATTQLQILNQ